MEAKPHILIADDQLPALLVLEEILEPQYDVVPFSDGRSLLDYLDRGGAADLVLTDVLMPEVDGFELCRRLKGDPQTRDIPVLFISGLEDDADESYALSLGADDFIHKPFSRPVVLARARSQLGLALARRGVQRHNDELER